MEKRKEIITVSNVLSEARYDLTEIGETMLLECLSFIQDAKIADKEEFTINLREFANYWNLNKNNIYRDIKNVTLPILKTYIEIQNLTDSSFILINIFDRIEYSEGKGLLTFRFGKSFIPYIQVKEGDKYWFKFYLETKKKLKGVKHSFKLYLLMQKNLYFSKRGQNVKYSLQELKQIIYGINNKEWETAERDTKNNNKNTYSKIYAMKSNDFKRQKLNPCVDHINTQTNLTVTYKDIKEGKQVVGFNFFITEKKPQKFLRDTTEKETIINEEEIENLREIVELELYKQNKIPIEYIENKIKMNIAIDLIFNVEWQKEQMNIETFEERQKRAVYFLMTDCLKEMLFEDTNIGRVKFRPYDAWEKLNRILEKDGDNLYMPSAFYLDFFEKYNNALKAQAEKGAEIKRKKNFIKTILYNHLSEWDGDSYNINYIDYLAEN